MKKILNGKLYNTDTAKLIGGYSYGTPRDFKYIAEDLYKKKTGEFFIAGEGGAMTEYFRQTGQNSYSGGEDIFPLTEKEAREWAEEHLTAEEYIEAFGCPEE